MRVSFGHTGSADHTGEGWDFEVGFEPTRFDKSKYVTERRYRGRVRYRR
jgi:hypothetical protein